MIRVAALALLGACFAQPAHAQSHPDIPPGMTWIGTCAAGCTTPAPDDFAVQIENRSGRALVITIEGFQKKIFVPAHAGISVPEEPPP